MVLQLLFWSAAAAIPIQKVTNLPDCQKAVPKVR